MPSPPSGPARRIDLHCHSNASNEASEVVLNAIGCPECYSRPQEVYEQAIRRGMDWVTITDHDSIDGVAQIVDRDDVLVGEELSCWFPEDGCKMHVLVWGITPADHAALQAAARDIYAVAAYLEAQQIAHAVAHPLYRQNGLLERWHVERLALLFKGFECVNGAHSALHGRATLDVLDDLTPLEIGRLAEIHRLRPHWPEPWNKARTGGSDDHGLLNIGRTWTEFPRHVQSVEDVLQCLRTGTCRAGGEAGSATKLAHNFYSVAVRYYTRQMLPAGAKPGAAAQIMAALVGERAAPTRGEIVARAVRRKMARWGRRIVAPWAAERQTGGAGDLLGESFLKSVRSRLGAHPELLEALRRGVAPLGEHDAVFRLAQEINRDMTVATADAIERRLLGAGQFTGVFDGIAAAMAQQFALAPYYFALFHQNQERQLLKTYTGRSRLRPAQSLRVGVFTDTFDDVNGVCRFLRDMGDQAHKRGRCLIVHTCSSNVRIEREYRRNFAPVFSRRLPYYAELQLSLPPVLEMLEWADRQQFDVIEISTPGPVGLCGWLVAKMLRVPVVGVYHTDFPAFVRDITGDARLAAATAWYMRLFYRPMQRVISRSRQYHEPLIELGVAPERLWTTVPGTDTEKFNRRRRDVNLWAELSVGEPYRLLYCGRISREKNLPLLVEAFKQLCTRRRDAALIVAGDGPYASEMRKQLQGLPAYFLGYLSDAELARLYASSDLYVFPSRTDTLGQVILEAQACGTPVLVSDVGGPKEVMDDGVTGRVIAGTDPAAWCKAIDELLGDELQRQRMMRNAMARISRYSLGKAFDAFWNELASVAGSADAGASLEADAAGQRSQSEGSAVSQAG